MNSFCLSLAQSILSSHTQVSIMSLSTDQCLSPERHTTPIVKQSFVVQWIKKAQKSVAKAAGRPHFMPSSGDGGEQASHGWWAGRMVSPKPSVCTCFRPALTFLFMVQPNARRYNGRSSIYKNNGLLSSFEVNKRLLLPTYPAITSSCAPISRTYAVRSTYY